MLVCCSIECMHLSNSVANHIFEIITDTGKFKKYMRY